MSRLSRIAALAAFASLGLAGQAFAHAHLKSTVPAADSAAASPTELDLTFSEGLNLKFSGVKVTGSDKADVSVGDASLKAGDDTTLIIPVSGTLTPGIYTVEWHVLSSDGHKTNGTYTFTVK
jgi:hypothetical protein